MDAEAWDDRYRTSELIWTAAPNRFVVEVLGGVAPGVGLDLACGEGRNAVWLAEQGWTMTGADFSGQALAKAAALAGARGVEVDWVQADAVTWSPPDGLDLVLIAYLHLPAGERRVVLGHALDACRGGGQVVVVGHALANLTDGYGGPQVPEILLEPDVVAAELAGVGAEVLRAELVTRPVRTDDGDRTAIDTLVVARR